MKNGGPGGGPGPRGGGVLEAGLGRIVESNHNFQTVASAERGGHRVEQGDYLVKRREAKPDREGSGERPDGGAHDRTPGLVSWCATFLLGRSAWTRPENSTVKTLG